jgi:hypothetical protein
VKEKSEHSRCSARLKSGEPCTHVAVTEEGLCRPCAKKATAANVEGPIAAENLEAATVSEVDELSEETEPVRIDSLRAALREGSSTAEVAALMQSMLLDGLRASKTVFCTCKKCGSRNPVDLPDLGTRVAAVRALVEELDGRVKQVTETADQKLEAARRRAESDLASCSDDELTLLVLASGEGEPPSMKEAARKLAEDLLTDRGADPKGWLRERLSADELEFLERVSANHHWLNFPGSVVELAEKVASAPALA